MVGKDAYFRVVIYETFMECAFDALEVYFVAAVGEYGFETFELTYIVRQYAQPVAFADKTRERVAYQVEVFMIYTLWRAVEVESRDRSAVGGCRGSGKFEAPHCLQLPGEFVSVDQGGGSIGLALFGKECECRYLRRCHDFDTLDGIAFVAHCHKRFV